jgi:HlyD family secretion protein
MTLKLSFMIVVVLALGGCDRGNEGALQGWVEADLIFVSPDERGRVETLKVREGQRVKKGDLLFTLDEDLQRSDLQVKRAAVETAQQAFERAQQLLKTAAGTQKTYDEAEAAVRQGKANEDWAQTRLMRRTGVSPADGVVQHVYFRPGETAPQGRAVLSLLPPGNLKIRFFPPETVLAKFEYGQNVQVSCDNCPSGLTAKVTFIASSAEYTPPVIYSRDERAKLVYLIEARPIEPERFRVGQPVTVTLQDGAAQ